MKKYRQLIERRWKWVAVNLYLAAFVGLGFGYFEYCGGGAPPAGTCTGTSSATCTGGCSFTINPNYVCKGRIQAYCAQAFGTVPTVTGSTFPGGTCIWMPGGPYYSWDCECNPPIPLPPFTTTPVVPNCF